MDPCQEAAISSKAQLLSHPPHSSVPSFPRHHLLPRAGRWSSFPGIACLLSLLPPPPSALTPTPTSALPHPGSL